MDTSAANVEQLLHVLVGEHLASGLTNDEILLSLQTENGLDIDEARRVLRAVYDCWISVRTGLDLQSEDDRNWHQHLRMKLLQRALKRNDTPSGNLALRVLDSLAGIQGISTIPEQTVPLPIVLVAREESEEAEEKKDDTR